MPSYRTNLAGFFQWCMQRFAPAWLAAYLPNSLAGWHTTTATPQAKYWCAKKQMYGPYDPSCPKDRASIARVAQINTKVAKGKGAPAGTIMAIICRDHDGMIWLAIQGHKVLSTLEELLLSEPHGLGVVEIDAVLEAASGGLEANVRGISSLPPIPRHFLVVHAPNDPAGYKVVYLLGEHCQWVDSRDNKACWPSEGMTDLQSDAVSFSWGLGKLLLWSKTGYCTTDYTPEQLSAWVHNGCFTNDPSLQHLILSCLSADEGKEDPFLLPRLLAHMGWRPTAASKRVSKLVCGIGSTLQDQANPRAPHDLQEPQTKSLIKAVHKGMKPFLLLSRTLVEGQLGPLVDVVQQIHPGHPTLGLSNGARLYNLCSGPHICRASRNTGHHDAKLRMPSMAAFRTGGLDGGDTYDFLGRQLIPRATNLWQAGREFVTPAEARCLLPLGVALQNELLTLCPELEAAGIPWVKYFWSLPTTLLDGSSWQASGPSAVTEQSLLDHCSQHAYENILQAVVIRLPAGLSTASQPAISSSDEDDDGSSTTSDSSSDEDYDDSDGRLLLCGVPLMACTGRGPNAPVVSSFRFYCQQEAELFSPTTILLVCMALGTVCVGHWGVMYLLRFLHAVLFAAAAQGLAGRAVLSAILALANCCMHSDALRPNEDVPEGHPALAFGMRLLLALLPYDPEAVPAQLMLPLHEQAALLVHLVWYTQATAGSAAAAALLPRVQGYHSAVISASICEAHADSNWLDALKLLGDLSAPSRRFWVLPGFVKELRTNAAELLVRIEDFPSMAHSAAADMLNLRSDDKLEHDDVRAGACLPTNLGKDPLVVRDRTKALDELLKEAGWKRNPRSTYGTGFVRSSRRNMTV